MNVRLITKIGAVVSTVTDPEIMKLHRTFRISPAKVGDRVKFTGEWLRSISAYTGPLGQLKGTIVSVKSRKDYAYVTVEWDYTYFENKQTNVLLCNLMRTT